MYDGLRSFFNANGGKKRNVLIEPKKLIPRRPLAYVSPGAMLNCWVRIFPVEIDRDKNVGGLKEKNQGEEETCVRPHHRRQP